jgi:thymidylate synthase
MRYAIDTLKANQWTRRAVITAWDPANAHLSKLPPCHVMMVFNVQNLDGVPHLCLHLTQRSADMFLGVPYNTAGYALILTLMSKWVGLPPGIFSHTLVDAHIYTRPEDWTEGDPVASGGTHETDANELLDHLPLMRRQIEREPRMMPVLDITEDFGLDDVPALLQRTKSELLEIFRLRFYDPHPAIRGAVAV